MVAPEGSGDGKPDGFPLRASLPGKSDHRNGKIMTNGGRRVLSATILGCTERQITDGYFVRIGRTSTSWASGGRLLNSALHSAAASARFRNLKKSSMRFAASPSRAL